MARPIKNYCDYFPHDKNMRNHKKVKALRNKFQITGYAVWNMLLEYITGSDGNVFEYSDIEFELLAGEFEVSGEIIRQIVDYCIRLEMLFLKDGFIHSESLDEKLSPVYEKRGKKKELSEKQRRINGKFAKIITVDSGINTTEKPHIKLN